MLEADDNKVVRGAGEGRPDGMHKILAKSKEISNIVKGPKIRKNQIFGTTYSLKL